MKTNDSHEDDRKLSETLRCWRTNAPLPPGFRDGVWRRIEQAETRPDFDLWVCVGRWISGALPRPRMALSYVTSLLLAGVIAGLWTARLESDRVNADLGSRYVESVDPYHAVASDR